MPEESPPPFIVIRTPVIPIARRPTPYQQALAIVALVTDILETATARFYLKDRMDRAATSVVFALGRAAEVRYGRWKEFRSAQAAAAQLATLLDIFAHQRAAAPQLVADAQRGVRELLEDLSPLAKG
jgi:hypothetical protein